MTGRGLQVLKWWDSEARLRGSGEAFLETLKRGDRKSILDHLRARRVIECETAALAAKHGSSLQYVGWKDFLAQQAASVGIGGVGIEHDVAFHIEITRTTSNDVAVFLGLPDA